jgi:hypothetical protein
MNSRVGTTIRDHSLAMSVSVKFARNCISVDRPSRSQHGLYRRYRLALACALKVVDRMKPYPDVFALAESMLAKGLMAMRGSFDLKLLQRETGALHTKVMDLFEHGEAAYVSAYAGFACVSALNTVLFDTDFDKAGADEMQIDPDDWDPSFSASLAMSGSAIWEKKGGNDLRRAFWQWYLNAAIPLAWEVTTPLSAVPKPG